MSKLRRLLVCVLLFNPLNEFVAKNFFPPIFNTLTSSFHLLFILKVFAMSGLFDNLLVEFIGIL